MRSSDRLVDLSVREFAARLASGDAVPAGGSAAALAAALGASVAAMVAQLTIGREKYAAHKDEMEEILEQAERLRGQLLALVDADAAAYRNVMVALRMPQGDDAERAGRQEAVQEAFRHAADVPAASAEACVQVLNLAARAAERGNKNAAGDAAVAALLAHAALQGAVRNVRINLRSIKDPAFVGAMESRIEGLLPNGAAALARALTDRN